MAMAELESYPDNQHSKGITVFFGGSGTGKTTYMSRAVALHAKLTSVAMLDVTGDLSKGVEKEGALVVRVTNIADFRRLVGRPFFKPTQGTIVAFTAPPKRPKEIQPAIDAFVEVLTTSNSQIQFGCYVSDEAELLFNGRQPELFHGAVYTARNHGTAIYLASKRPTHIPTAVRSCTIRAVVFKLRSDMDARAVEELGPSVLFRNRVQDLSIGRALYYCGQGSSDRLPVIDSLSSHVPWLVKELSELDE